MKAKRNLVGSALIFLGLLGLQASRSAGKLGIPPEVGCVAPLGFALFVGGVLLVRRSRKETVASATVVMAEDSRPPVLFLRSFADDKTAEYLFDPEMSTKGLTYEEQLVAALQPIGPVIALGDPADPLPDLGAARLYLPPASGEGSAQTWEDIILDFLGRSRLVVLRVGDVWHRNPESALRWEIRQVVERVLPERIVFLIGGGRATYAALCGELEAAVSKKMNAGWRMPRARELPWRTWFRLYLPSARWVRLILYFDRSWKPFVVPFLPPRFNGDRASPLTPGFTRALRPVFEGLEVGWKAPPGADRRVVAALLILIGLIGLTIAGMLLWYWMSS